MSGYTLSVTRDELHALSWLGSCGYCGGAILYDAVQVIEEDGTALIEMPEHVAWAWREAAESDGDEGLPYYTCAGPDLVTKLRALWESIV